MKRHTASKKKGKRGGGIIDNIKSVVEYAGLFFDTKEVHSNWKELHPSQIKWNTYLFD